MELSNPRITAGNYVAGPDPIHIPRPGDGSILVPLMGVAAGWDASLDSGGYVGAPLGTHSYALLLAGGDGAAYQATWPVAGGGDDGIVFDDFTVRLDIHDGLFDVGRLTAARSTMGEEAARRPTITICNFGQCICIDWEAVTNVNSYQVYLCQPFLDAGFDGANTLIHEALHTAGLPEYPPTPGAMTPGEINQMVRDACGP